MEAAKETKVNGKVKAQKAALKPTSSEKPPKTKKQTVWALARKMLAEGAKDEAIKKAVYELLLKTLNPQKALEQWSARVAYRALFRAKRSAKKGTKEKKNAA